MIDETESCTPPEVREKAKSVGDELLPKKSKDFYLKVYGAFKDWCESKGIANVSENVLLVYFQERAKNKKASSLWAIYSMLKATIKLKENLDISKYFKVIAFLKRQNDSYIPKKAAVFDKDQIQLFINEAPDEAFLSDKVVLIIGIAGACRTDELCNLKLSDLDVREDMIIINIRTSKNGTSRKFVIMEPVWVSVVKKYLGKRPTPDMEKLFIGFRSGKPVRQNMGHNTIGGVPKKVAAYLKLPNINSYTGHTLRRTSATLLADNGGDILSLKRHGGWKSSTVAEGYVEDSLADKKRIASMVQGNSTENPRLSTSAPLETVSAVASSSQDQVPTLSSSIQNNTQLNIPIASVNTGASSINMTCHNCTINYYFR